MSRHSDVIGEILAGQFLDLAQKLSGPDGAEWKKELGKFLHKRPTWQDAPGLLMLTGTVVIPVVPPFSVVDRFVVGIQDGVVIGYVGDNFKRMFGNHAEPETPDTTLRIHQLMKLAKDPAIIAELGGEQTAETTLGQMWEMLKIQGEGQDGRLLNNGYVNIFYVRSQVDNQLWAVLCFWRSGRRYWVVSARPVSAPLGWIAGGRVFSRDS